MNEREELKRRLDTVWRMASTGFETLREVVVRSSQAGRLRVDSALLARERQHYLGQLGDQVARLLDEGRLELPEDSMKTYERIRELEQRIRAERVRAQDNAFGAPRGYEPEAGNYEDEGEDEHAEVARWRPGSEAAASTTGEPAKRTTRPARKGGSR